MSEKIEVSATKSQADRIKELEAKLAKQESEQQQLQDAAVKKVLDLAGLKASDLQEVERHKKQINEVHEYDIGTQVVSINGKSYTGRGKATYGEVEMIISMAANARHQKMREMIGQKFAIETLDSGAIRSRYLGEVTAD